MKKYSKFKQLFFFQLILFTLIFASIFQTNLVSSAPPFSTTSTNDGCQITPVVRDTLTVKRDFDFNFHTFNLSNGYPLSNTSLSCVFHLYNQTGDHVMSVFLKNDPYLEHFTTNEWVERMAGKNISSVGTYAYLVQCNGTVLVGGCANKGVIMVVTDSDLGLFLILALAAVIILMIAVITRSEYMGFIAGALLIVTGVYTMIYGVSGFASFYTQAIALICLGLGFIFLLASAYSAISDAGFFSRGGQDADDVYGDVWGSKQPGL